MAFIETTLTKGNMMNANKAYDETVAYFCSLEDADVIVSAINDYGVDCADKSYDEIIRECATIEANNFSK